MASPALERLKLEKLKIAAILAIKVYQAQHPNRSSSKHRSADIEALIKIVGDAKDKEQLYNQLEDYFASDTFHTGFRDKSALEDGIIDALFEKDPDLRTGVYAFGTYKPEAIKGDATPTGAVDSTIKLNYSLDDFINFAIRKYKEERPNISADRESDILFIETYLNSKQTYNTPEVKIENIKNYLEKIMKKTLTSDLKKYIEQAIKAYQETPTRQVATRVWGPANAKKVMIFLHGWHDSVDAGNELARQAIKEGYKVIAYDHRGHGKDDEREKKGISTDLLRLDFEKFLEKVKADHPDAEIALVGHSMGGAILTAANRKINSDPQIKSVSLLAPAVMSSVGKLASPAKAVYRNMHKDVVTKQKATTRFGGNGPSLFGLLNFMRKAARALKAFFTSPDPMTAKWKIYSGKKDASVNYTEFEALQKEKADSHVGIQFFRRGDHALQFGHRSGTVIRQVLKDTDEAMKPITVVPRTH